MEEVNKQEEVLGYELTTQMDVLLRKVEKHVFNPHYLEDRDKRDLENLVSLVRQELMNGAITQATVDKRKWLTQPEVAVKVEAAKTEAFFASLGIVREELVALEDRVTDMETRMLGTSLSPRDWEEGEG